MIYNADMTGKILTNYRLSDDARAAIETLAKKLGVSKTDIVEMAIREFAESKGVQLQPKK